MLSFDDSGNVEHRYLHGDGIDELWADESTADGLLWALADRQGTVNDWAAHDSTTGTTSVANHIEYDAYANIVSQTDPNHVPPVGFTGQDWDADVGLYYYSAGIPGGRWYDPVSGSFSKPDDMGFGAGDENLYRYVGNSPGNYIDPSGMSAFVAALPFAGGAAAVDGPLPVGDVIAGALLTGAAAVDLTLWLRSDDKSEEMTAVDGAGKACSESELTPTGTSKTEPCTRKGNKGGTSVQEGYKDSLGRDVTKHIIYCPKGKIIHGPHYRPGGFK